MATRKSGKREKRNRKKGRRKSLGSDKSGRDTKRRSGDARASNRPVIAGDAETTRGWAVLAELLGKRAGMRVLWELRGAPLKFRALQEACDGLSPSTLNQRLSDLREARLVALEDRQGYCLTPQGEELVELLAPVAGWADGWSRRRAQKR